MATITLQDYYEKLEELLSKNAYEEVIRHSRHILQFFPKSANVFRFLGRALLESGETGEAGEIFRRLLGVYPDDYVAHVSLSKVYQKLNKPDDALWHLERAFEQDPNNQSLIDALRELYQRYRKVEQTKLQLTAAAVARQYVRNELYGQAIDVLQQAIDRSPERMDLRVLLAQTLWDGNQRLEAGEKALDVLDTLPDCLVANRIMTELWLGEKRPSDAQRFLTHIEGVEPYMALQLAKGEVSDSDLTLDELDYSRLAQQELAMASPDWLQDLGDISDDQMMEDEPSFHEIPADPTQQSPDEDWLKTLADASAEKTVNLTKDELLAAKKAAAERAKSSGIDNEDDWMAEMEEAGKKPTSSLDGLFDDIPSSTSSTAGFTDFLDTLSTAPTDRPTAPAAQSDEVDDALDWLQQDVADKPVAANPNDPLAWMRGSGIEIDENAEVASESDPYGTDDELQLPSHDTKNPLDWLKGYDVEQPTAPTSTDDDALGWMHAGSSIDDDMPTPTPVVKPTPAPMAKPQPQNVSDDSLLDEMLHMEELSATGSWEMPAVSADDAASFATDDEMPDWLADTETPEATAEEELPEAAIEEEALGWLNDDALPEAAVSNTPDWISGADMEEIADEDDALAWMNDADDEAVEEPVAEANIPDWLSGSAEDVGDAETPEAEPEINAMSWLDAPALEDDEETVTEPVEYDAPDWLADDSALEEEPVATADEEPVAWMSAASTEETLDDEEIVAEAETPDWLSSSGFAEATSDEELYEEPVATADEDPLAWMGTASAETLDDEEIVAEAETPDWLSSSGFAETIDEKAVYEEPIAAADEDPLAWMNAASAEETLDDEEIVAEADAPDWLSDSGFAEATSDEELYEEPVAEADEDPLAWMGTASAEILDEEIVAEADTPNWLSSDGFAETTDDEELYEEPVAEEDGLAWMNDTVDEQPEEELAAEAEMPDWLSAAPSQEEEPVAEEDELAWMNDDSQPEADAVLSTLSDEELPIEALTEGQTTMPDDQQPAELPIVEAQAAEGEAVPLAEARDDDFILSAAVTPEVLAQIEAETEAAPPVEGAFAAIDPIPHDDLDEIPAPPMETLPDLLAMPPDSDAPKVAQEESSLEWMDQGDAQPISDETPGWSEEAVAEADTPDWLSHPTTEEPAVMNDENDVLEAEADAPDWLSGFGDDQPISDETALDEELVASDEVALPDWSSEITFGEEDEAAEVDTPDWLSSGFVDAEAVEDEVEEEIVASDEDAPDWLSGSSFGDAADDEEAVADAPDWLSSSGFGDTADDDEAVEEEIVASDEDAPDWLAGVGYGDDEAVEEEILATDEVNADAPDWLSGSGFADDDEAVEEEILATDEVEEDAPDWLADMTFGEEETAEEAELEEAVASDAVNADAPDWLSDVSLDDEEEIAQPVASVEDDDQDLDWMSELEAASPSSTEFVDQPEDLSWENEDEEVEDDQPLISQGKTDWLSSVGIGKREPALDQPEDFGSDFSWADDEAETDDSSDMPSWAAQEFGSEVDSEFDWANELNNDETPTKALRSEVEVEETSVDDDEYAPVAADNAPDWLNAMVPGLDVDPEEEEDAPIEQSYAEDNGGHRVRAAAEAQSGFNWLTNIVDEETSAQPAAAPSMMPEELPTAPVAKAPKQPRFSFSRLPAWLRPKSAAPAPAPAAAPVVAPAVAPTSVTEEPDWLREAEDTGDNSDDNDDFDMPDWLK